MHKLLTAILAILSLAGALCAISGATPPPNSVHPVAIVGEGPSPFPMAVPSVSSHGDAGQPVDNF